MVHLNKPLFHQGPLGWVKWSISNSCLWEDNKTWLFSS